MQGLLNHEYDGNAWWAVMLTLDLCLIAQSLRYARSMHRLGKQFESRQAIRGGILLLIFVAISLTQILTHPW
ncbi:MAG: hypothetical protein ABIZ18_07575 [Caldimonas sp.]